MLKLLTLTFVVVTSFSGVGTSTAQAESQKRCTEIHQGINFYRSATHRFQMTLNHPITRASKFPIRGCQYAKWVAERWRKRARGWKLRHEKMMAVIRERRQRYLNLYNKWACIHEHEGAWNANTGNGYYGGLQMDVQFQQSHGAEFLQRWGTANNWPVWAQLEAAENAYQTRGFNPWPNTARMCGLL